MKIKNTLSKLGILVALFTLAIGCAPAIKVTNSYADTSLIPTLKKGNNLVIVKSENKNLRFILENTFQKKLAEKGIESEEAIVKFPPMIPNKERTEQELKELVQIFKNENFNTVILTVLKEVDETVYTQSTGGYYTGRSYYPMYYSGFVGYYGYYYDPGVYVPRSTTTQVSKNYHLETVIYDLNAPEGKQLLSVTSVEVEDPREAHKIASKYVDAVIKNIESKK